MHTLPARWIILRLLTPSRTLRKNNMENTLIRPATTTDAESIVGIYNHYVENTVTVGGSKNAMPRCPDCGYRRGIRSRIASTTNGRLNGLLSTLREVSRSALPNSCERYPDQAKRDLRLRLRTAEKEMSLTAIELRKRRRS